MMSKMTSLLAATLLVVTLPPIAMAEEGANPAVAPAAENPTPASNLEFKNCTEARDRGYRDIHKGQPGYGLHLDSDNDGIACEVEEDSAPAPAPEVQPAPAPEGQPAPNPGDAPVSPAPAPAPAVQCGPNAADHLLISEYHYDTGFNEDTWNPSYVELYNPTPETIDLSHYTLRSSEGGILWNSVDLQGSMKPCSYFLIGLKDYNQIRDRKRTDIEFPEADLTTDLFVGSYGAILVTKDIPAKTPYNPKTGPAPVDMLGLSDLQFFEGDQAYFFRDKDFELVQRHGESLTRTDSTVDTDNNAADFSAQPMTPTNQMSVAGGESRPASGVEKTESTPVVEPPAVEPPALEPPAPDSVNAQSPAPVVSTTADPTPAADPAAAVREVSSLVVAASTSTKAKDPEAEAVAAAALALSKGVAVPGNKLGKTAQRVVIVSVPSGPLELGEGMPSTI